jgi:small-conductance mechanosensitive channel
LLLKTRDTLLGRFLRSTESLTQESAAQNTLVAEKDQEITELKQTLEKIQTELSPRGKPKFHR